MGIDPDVQVLLDDIYARLDATEARLDALEAEQPPPPEPEPEPEPDWSVRHISRTGTYTNQYTDVILELAGVFDRNVRIMNEHPGANLILRAPTWHIWDKSLTSKGQHMALKLEGEPYGDVRIVDMHAIGDGLTEGVQVATRIDRLDITNARIGPIYGGLNTNAEPHDGWGVSPNHADYLQCYGGGSIGHLIFDRCVFEGELGGGNKIVQDVAGIERMTTRNWCRFAVAQGPPDDDGYYGGAPSAPFVGLRPGLEWHDDGTSTCLSNQWWPAEEVWRHWIGPMTPA